MTALPPLPAPDFIDEDQAGNRDGYYTADQMRQYAEQAVAAERERCAKICESRIADEYATGKVDHNEMAWTNWCAIAIRKGGST